MGVCGQRHYPATLPPGKTRYSLCRRLGGPHGRSGWMRKISPPPGLDPRTVQPVASRYTDYAIPANVQKSELLTIKSSEKQAVIQCHVISCGILSVNINVQNFRTFTALPAA